MVFPSSIEMSLQSLVLQAPSLILSSTSGASRQVHPAFPTGQVSRLSRYIYKLTAGFISGDVMRQEKFHREFSLQWSQPRNSNMELCMSNCLESSNIGAYKGNFIPLLSLYSFYWISSVEMWQVWCYIQQAYIIVLLLLSSLGQVWRINSIVSSLCINSA